MVPADNTNWTVGETLTTLNDDTQVCLVHTAYPRCIATLRSGASGQAPSLDVHWSEKSLNAVELANLNRDAVAFFLEYNLAAYGRAGPSWRF